MIENLLHIRMAIAQFYEEFKEGMNWYVQEMNNLKAIIQQKDQEIAELKQKVHAQLK